MPENDEEIILQYQSGNQSVFKELINRYSSPVFNFTARLTDKDNASDIVQEVFIKVWKNLGKFNPEKATFKTWIFTIARNTATDFLRKKKSVLFSDMEKQGEESDLNSIAENIRDESLLPNEVLEKLEDVKTLEEALNNLSLASREVLLLHYREEMTFDEIGKVMGKPLNTVKSKHRRALIELRKVLDKKDERN